MFFDPAIVSTLQLREQPIREDKSPRASALVLAKRKVERSRRQRNLGFNLKRQA
jgi:hypothetical protein